ncbi:MAG: hypothetical protein L0Y64_02580 [Myxococcaceae bacterium]|nr:hypothetical protein [Myxococcaceae bacterium]
MPTFASNTVHGLTADVYFNSSPVRVFGEISLSITAQTLPLTANDLGAVDPVDVLRRGETVTVTVPITDMSGLGTVSGVILPFTTSVSGASGTEILLTNPTPGDSFLDKAKELRLVLRDGSATWIFPLAVATEPQELTLSEEEQSVWAVVFTCYRSTVSGVNTPFRLISGSVVTGP